MMCPLLDKPQGSEVTGMFGLVTYYYYEFKLVMHSCFLIIHKM